MGFWIFMTIMNLLIPSTMIGFGSYFMKKPPKRINDLFGYRTTMSMKNRDTWEFAHHYAGKIWLITGWAALLISIIAMLLLLGQNTETIGRLGGIICLLQCIPLVAVIPPTEIALKKKFDKHGNRK
ncbi:MAG TPA: SdpI family protein [Clostridiales bacterium]|nr:SdpI family protein [Clostridiales bacterium]